jgi:hypothetical protein
MKVIGYSLSVAGLLVGVLSKIPVLNQKISGLLKFLPKDFFIKFGIYIGVALVVIGLIIAMSSQGQRSKEVPIYQGKQIVGYRRA